MLPTTLKNWKEIEDEFRMKQFQRLLTKPAPQKDQTITVTTGNEVYQSANSFVPPDNSQIQAEDNALTSIDSGIEAGQDSGVESDVDNGQDASPETGTDMGADCGPDSDMGV